MEDVGGVGGVGEAVGAGRVGNEGDVGKMEEAKKLLAEALRIPVDKIGDDMQMRDLSTWDSLNHMNLIILIEERLVTTLTMDEILAITSVRGLAEILNRKAKA